MNKRVLFWVAAFFCAAMAVFLLREGWNYHIATFQEAFMEEVQEQSWRSPAAAVGNAKIYMAVRPLIICGGLLLIPAAFLAFFHHLLFALAKPRRTEG